MCGCVLGGTTLEMGYARYSRNEDGRGNGKNGMRSGNRGQIREIPYRISAYLELPKPADRTGQFVTVHIVQVEIFMSTVQKNRRCGQKIYCRKQFWRHR